MKNLIGRIMTYGNGGTVMPNPTVNPVASVSSPVPGQTISVTTGTWSGSGSPTYSYQWQINSNNITGQTTNSCVIPAAAQLGDQISCRVTRSDASGINSVWSNSITVQ